jgi:dethiobiotin synthetase
MLRPYAAVHREMKGSLQLRSKEGQQIGTKPVQSRRRKRNSDAEDERSTSKEEAPEKFMPPPAHQKPLSVATTTFFV